MRRSSMTADTLPGTWSSVNSGAEGNSSHRTSRQRSPPRMPVSQSWTSATRSGDRTPDLLPPVVEKVAQRVLEADLGLPACRAQDLARVAHQQRHVGGTHAIGARPDADVRGLGRRDEELEHVADGPRLSRAQ